jgi:uncharacterized protein YbjT (DUF2867 family)
VRALVRRPEQGRLVQEQGALEVLSGDMRNPEALEEAARGATAVYLICPNVSPDEVAMGRCMIAEARGAGVEHLVYHSVLHPQTESMPHHWQKLRVEELIFESGLPFTILQPAAYMQNVLAHWEKIQRDGLFPVPYDLEARISIVDLEDVAEAAAIVLSQPGHEGANYELAGPEAPSQVEVAGIIGRELGRPVWAEFVPLDTWEQGARAGGMTEYQVETLLKMFRYYDAHGFIGNPRVLGWLLGRPPGTFEQFVRRVVESH